MGREVRRVPVDFDWPMEVWPGFYLSICNDMEKAGCDRCRQFARLAGLDKDLCADACPDLTIPPPKGDGWQMWETCSEGSPISPVFASPEELARWLADTGASAFGLETATYDEWLRMINRGWAPSGIVVDGKLKSGVAGLPVEKTG